MLRKKNFPSVMIRYFFYTVLLQYLETVRSTYPQQRFDDFAHNVTVTEGKQAILPCHVESNDNLLIIWMNPKKIMISDRESRFIDDPRMSVERPFVGDYNLHIRNVRYDDRGEYTCTINSIPVQTKRIRLIVKVPSKFVGELLQSTVTTIEGSTVQLTCNATGIPPPNITWFRRLSLRDEDREQVGTMGELLIIHNITRHCGGRYECMAFNGVQPAISKNIDVEVHFKPEIEILNKRLGQKKDKETMLQCMVTASPQGDIQWKIGDREISKDYSGYRTEVYPEVDGYTVTIALRILNVQDKDFGIYTCEAKNALGSATADMELYEYIEPTVPPTTTTTTIVSTTTRKIRHNTRIKSKDNMQIEKDEDDQEDHRNQYVHKQDTQVSGHIGTGEYSNSTGTQYYVCNVLLTILVLLIKVLV